MLTGVCSVQVGPIYNVQTLPPPIKNIISVRPDPECLYTLEHFSQLLHTCIATHVMLA